MCSAPRNLTAISFFWEESLLSTKLKPSSGREFILWVSQLTILSFFWISVLELIELSGLYWEVMLSAWRKSCSSARFDDNRYTLDRINPSVILSVLYLAMYSHKIYSTVFIVQASVNLSIVLWILTYLLGRTLTDMFFKCKYIQASSPKFLSGCWK